MWRAGNLPKSGLVTRALLIAVVVSLVAPAAASACSIAARPAEERVRAADVAVWGKVVAREKVGEDEGIGQQYRYRLRVIETYKGRLRRRMRLLAHDDPGTCGLRFDVGERVGLVLEGRRGPWRIGLADLISRAELRSVRRPRRG